MAQMGRPRTFDRDQAIDQAMLLFWQQGYDSTSLNQLKANMGTGITAPSFYAAFGSKEGLFKDVVARYMDTHGRVNDSLFDPALPAREALERALRSSARMQCDASHPLGCMVALGTLGSCSTDSEVTKPLSDARARTRAGLLACVERGISNGELPATTSAQVLATVFESFQLGISPLARDGVALAVIEAAITTLMEVWSPCQNAGKASRLPSI